MSAPVKGTVVSTMAPTMVGAVATMSGVTCGGANRGLVVDVFVDYPASPVLPDSVTFNGLTMTLIKNVTAITGYTLHARYYRTAPTSGGSHDVVVSCTTGGAPLKIGIIATPLEDVDQTTPYNSSASATWDQVNPTGSLTLVDSNSATGCLEIDCALAVRGGLYPQLLNAVDQTNTAYLSGDVSYALAGSTKPGEASIAMAWTGWVATGGGVAWSLISTCFNPVGATGSPGSDSLFFDDSMGDEL